MRRWLLLLLVALLLVPQSASVAQESLSLTTPVTPTGPTTTAYTVQRLLLAWDDAFIYILVRDNNGVSTPAFYAGAQATTLMRALNVADLPAMSLHRRILQQLVKDGKLPPGSITGTPQ